MGAQGRELALERRAGVHPDVGLIRPEQVQPVDRVGRQAGTCQVREGHRVARRRVHGVDRRHGRGTVVRVLDPPGAAEEHRGVHRQHGVRAELADGGHELLAKGQVVGQRPVGRVQEGHRLVADDRGRGPLLGLARGRQDQGVDGVVVRPGVAAGAADEMADRAGVDPAGHRAGRAEVGVIGVGHDDHRPLGSGGVRLDGGAVVSVMGRVRRGAAPGPPRAWRARPRHGLRA